MTKYYCLFLIFISTLVSCKVNLTDEQLNQMWQAYRSHDYFNLDHLVNQVDVKCKDPELILFKAKCAYVFNQSELSCSLIKTLLNKKVPAFNDTIIADLYYMLSYNQDRLYNYSESYKYSKELIEKYGKYYDSVLYLEIKDDFLMREALIGQRSMRVIKNGETKIPISRDMAGLMNVPVIVNNDTNKYIFDTGANLSVLTESEAEKYGFKILDKKIFVYAFTGKRIQAGLALVNLKLGNAEVYDSPFLVLPDSVLSFADGAYVIRGIIGFPVMMGCEELIFTKGDSLIIPVKASTGGVKNFALDDFTPVIQVRVGGKYLPFHFDTGAGGTTFSSRYFEMNKNEIAGNYKKTVQNIGGAGGNVEFEVYLSDTITLTVGNASLQLDSLKIFPEAIGSEEYTYGNFGQDFISKFEEMRINFRAMNVSFSN